MALLLVPRAPGAPALSFDFRYGLGDVVVASALRAGVISATYAYGTRRQFLRCGAVRQSPRRPRGWQRQGQRQGPASGPGTGLP